jgi:putative transposase
MTNHVHFVVVPAREDSLAALSASACSRYAQAVNIHHGRSGHLWTALGYVESNPCRANLAERAEDYRCSSAAVHLAGVEDRSDILDLQFYRETGGQDRWRELRQNQPTQQQVA